jgi:hypothetical protein
MVNSILHFVRGKNCRAAAIPGAVHARTHRVKLSPKHKWVGKPIKGTSL